MTDVIPLLHAAYASAYMHVLATLNAYRDDPKEACEQVRKVCETYIQIAHEDSADPDGAHDRRLARIRELDRRNAARELVATMSALHTRG